MLQQVFAVVSGWEDAVPSWVVDRGQLAAAGSSSLVEPCYSLQHSPKARAILAVVGVGAAGIVDVGVGADVAVVAAAAD